MKVIKGRSPCHKELWISAFLILYMVLGSPFYRALSATRKSLTPGVEAVCLLAWLGLLVHPLLASKSYLSWAMLVCQLPQIRGLEPGSLDWGGSFPSTLNRTWSSPSHQSKPPSSRLTRTCNLLSEAGLAHHMVAQLKKQHSWWKTSRGRLHTRKRMARCVLVQGKLTLSGLREGQPDFKRDQLDALREVSSGSHKV